jgi:hypothetical protein
MVPDIIVELPSQWFVALNSLIVSETEHEWRLADEGRIAQARPDRIDAAFERADMVT